MLTVRLRPRFSHITHQYPEGSEDRAFWTAIAAFLNEHLIGEGKTFSSKEEIGVILQRWSGFVRAREITFTNPHLQELLIYYPSNPESVNVHQSYIGTLEEEGVGINVCALIIENTGGGA